MKLQHRQIQVHLGGSEYSEPECSFLCQLCALDHQLASLATLWTNLAAAGALCESFTRGHVDGYHEANRERGIPQNPRYPDLRDWRPGCELEARR